MLFAAGAFQLGWASRRWRARQSAADRYIELYGYDDPDFLRRRELAIISTLLVFGALCVFSAGWYLIVLVT